MRLIDADALEKGLKDWYCDPKNCDSWNGVRCRACLLDDALNAIEDAPTVERAVEEVEGTVEQQLKEQLNNS